MLGAWIIVTLILSFSSVFAKDSTTQAFTAFDFKDGLAFQGKSIVIKRFCGTLIIKSHEADTILAKTEGSDEAALRDYVLDFDAHGNVNLDWHHDRKTKDHLRAISLTLTLPKTMPLELHLTTGEAHVDPRDGTNTLIIEGEGKIIATGLGEGTKISINGMGDVTLIDMKGKPFEAKINGSGHIFVKDRVPETSFPLEKPKYSNQKDVKAPSYV